MLQTHLDIGAVRTMLRKNTNIYGDGAVPLPVLSTILHAFHIAGVWHDRREDVVLGQNRFFSFRKSGFISCLSHSLLDHLFVIHGYLQEQVSHARP